jgi:phosphohistidine swiveling domain-containing protein
MPHVIPLARATDPACGGKARGLARLIAAGLRVPDGFVIVGARPDALPVELGHAYAELGGGAVAVRSSAVVEDGALHSFAGVFESVLGVEGEPALREAVTRCLSHAHGERARAYAGATVDERMSVVVQRMVDARRAGVLFTLDPVHGQDGRWCIEAVHGLGEGLVSGRERPDRYHVDPRDAAVLEREPGGPQAGLGEAEIATLVEQAKLAQARMSGEPLDMEWAIDDEGTLYWLQARPITSAGPLPLDDLDTPIDAPTPGFTRYNVGEILPGAITPLTATTVVEMIDGGFGRAYARMGIYDRDDPPDRSLVVCSGHLFISLRGPYLFAAKVAAARKDDADRSLGGRVFEELEGYAPRGAWRRLRAAVRVLPILRRAHLEIARVEAGLATHRRPLPEAPAELVVRLEELVRFGTEVGEAHMLATTWSGMLAGVLQNVVTGGKPPTAEQRRCFTTLLQGIGEVESADIGLAIEALAAALREHPAAALRLHDDPADLAAWLVGPEAGVPGERWRAFLEQHGHRCFRELELRERDWAEDPSPVLAALRASLSTTTPRVRPRPVAIDELPVSRGTKRGLRWILPRAHEAIRLRERGKSLLVRVARLTKACCMQLGERLALLGGPAELDLVCFLTRTELGELALAPRERGVPMARLAARRRHALVRQQALRFPMVSRGKPTPLPAAPLSPGMQEVRGTPVSGGIVEGFARVARTPADAHALRPGEILIVPFTDAGWIPCFGLAAGLATEIGGTLSHGAVVARELGLPAVVDLDRVTELFETGQRVRLDADTGVLQALEAPPSRRPSELE